MTSEPLTIHSDTLPGRITVTTAERGDVHNWLDPTHDSELWKAVELAFEGAGGWRTDATLDALIETGVAAIPDDMQTVVIIDGVTWALYSGLSRIAERLIIAQETR